VTTLEAHVVSIPMRVPFRGITTREALLLKGPSGWGEFAPFLEYDDVEATAWLAAAVEAATAGWPSPVRTSVPVNATVPAITDVGPVLDRFPGCTTAKVKVAQAGQSLAEDVARVAAVRERVPNVRVDANGAWSVEEAVTALRALGDLEYCEQPCATVEELALVRARVDVLIAADESVRKASDPLRVARAGAADVIVLKVAPLGGVRRGLAIAAECGLPVVVSSALDTSVGIAAGVALAAALPSLPYACGLATTALLEGDVVQTSWAGGALARLDVDEDLVERWAAPADRRDWWLARYARVLELLP
jgi:O-succinylbenzoate synthase